MGEMQPGSRGDHVGRKKKQQQQQQKGAAAGDLAVVVGCRKKNSGRMQGAGRGGQLQPAAAAGSRPKQQQQQQQQLVVVGMDLTVSCRELLTWVLTKQAQPGDHIVTVHVSAFSALVRHPAGSAAAAAAAAEGNVSFAQRLFCLVPARVVLSFRALVAEEALVIIS
jgi:hypothetical protein